MARRIHDFQTIRSEGGLLPPDLLRRMLDSREKFPGTRPEDYNLAPGERLSELITQSWNRLRRHWAEFRAAAEGLPTSEAGTGFTNDKWSLPLLRELGFGLLPTSAGPAIDGRTYPINRFFGPVPIHLLGCGLKSLDRRAAGVRGAAAANPHGLVQEFLNRSGDHLWGLLSNGLTLRILRDSRAFSRQSFLEFDLEAMFSGEVYSDFVLLWLVAHATRFVPLEGNRPETCRLEQWTKLAAEQGTRALLDLRGGVENALRVLGEGFAGHSKNTRLREALRSGETLLSDFHGQLLRVVYRLIFLFVAEDRTIDGVPLLHPRSEPDTAALARERYAAHYGTGRLRDMASRIRGSRHGDLWRQFQVLVGALSGDPNFAGAREHLALPVLGSFLWDPSSTMLFNDAELTNQDFLESLRHLAFTRQGKVLRPVDYRNLGAEELGGVYESLLALTPQISADGARFTFAEFAGSERKTSGSYYTPDSLVQCLLDSALDPVVEEAIKGKTGPDAEKAILSLRVCDPAVGSGHFLVGAAHRLARHLAGVRALARGESEPSPLLYQHALRDIIGRCLYGVDLNPMAAELCRVSLWLEALEPGKPLSFLDHHIRVGNSLLGATPDLIAAGLPDAAFTPVEGDDRKACSALKKRNSAERKGLGPLFAHRDAEIQSRLERAASALEELPDDHPEDIRTKELAFRRHEETEEFRRKKKLADAWCAAFVIRKYFPPHTRDPRFPSNEPSGITQGRLNTLANGRPLPDELDREVECLSRQYRFFHWHLAFPEVFARGGFDCVLGNPPWERLKMNEQVWFADAALDIANAPTTAARKKLIDALQSKSPALFHKFRKARRAFESVNAFIRVSGGFPLSSGGELNLATLFAESSSRLLNTTGQVGAVLPTTVITDKSAQPLCRWWLNNGRLVTVFDFENRRKLFSHVDSRYKFSLITLRNGSTQGVSVKAAFYLQHPDELASSQNLLHITLADIARVNPNTLSFPVSRSRQDAQLLLAMHRRARPLLLETGESEGDPWGYGVFFVFEMNKDSDLFFAEPGSGLLPLLEAKLIHQFEHRAATFSGQSARDITNGNARESTPAELMDPLFASRPRFWISQADVDGAFERGQMEHPWAVVAREITNSTNERTVISCVIPRSGMGHTCWTLRLTKADAALTSTLVANFNSLPFDYAARQKIGGTHLSNFILKQLPVLTPDTYARECPWSCGVHLIREWLLPRVLELTYTAWDLEPFAQDCGWNGPPFRWAEERRFLLRCELDAAFFHFYLPAEANGDWKRAEDESTEDLARLKESFPTPRRAVTYIMGTFPIVKRKDEAKWGTYRTRDTILDIYDAMAEAIRSGQSYRTRLDPPPGPPEDGLPHWEPDQKKPPNWPSHIHPPKGISSLIPDPIQPGPNPA